MDELHAVVARVAGGMSLALVRRRAGRSLLLAWASDLRRVALALEEKAGPKEGQP